MRKHTGKHTGKQMTDAYERFKLRQSRKAKLYKKRGLPGYRTKIFINNVDAFPEVLCKLVKDSGLTWEAVAQKADVSPPLLYNYAHRNYNPRKYTIGPFALYRVLEALEVSEQDVLDAAKQVGGRPKNYRPLPKKTDGRRTFG